MQRTFTADNPEPITLDLDIGPGDITVFTEDRDFGQVTVEPVDPDDTSASDLVSKAVYTGTGESLGVAVPRPTNTAGVAQTAHQAADVGGIVLSSGGTISIDGQVTKAVNSHAHASGAVRVTARLPKSGSSVRVRTDSARLTTRNYLVQVSYRSRSGDLDVFSAELVGATTVSGDIAIDEADDVTASTTSGDLCVRRAARFSARAVSGDVAVEELADMGKAVTVSGDVKVCAVADSTLIASTVSGDIRLSARPGVDLSASTHTVSGHIRHPHTRAA